MRKFASLFAALTLLLAAHAGWAQNFWEPANGPIHGTIRCIAFDSSGGIFVATLEKDLYRSRDSGHTWVFLDSSLYKAGGASGILVLATGPDSQVYASEYGNGLFRSTDDGSTWSFLTKTTVYSILVTKQNTLYAYYPHLMRWDDSSKTWITILKNGSPPILSPSGSIYSAAGDSLFSISDSGATPIGTPYEYMACDPNGKLFALTDSGCLSLDTSHKIWQHYPSQHPIDSIVFFTIDRLGNFIAEFVMPGTGFGLYKSQNDGEVWTPLWLSSHAESVGQIQAFGVAPTNDYYLGFWFALAHSSDQGKNWNNIEQGIAGLWDGMQAIAVTHKQNIIAATAVSLFRSSDHGMTWTTLDSGLNYNPSALAVTPSGRILLGSTAIGVLISDNEGNSWSLIRNSGNVSSFAFDAGTPIYAATPMGIMRSPDNGSDWQTTALNGSCISTSVAPNGTVFALSSFGDLYRSTNQGNSWTVITPQNFQLDAISVTRTGKVLASGNGLLQSDDNGITWKTIDNSRGYWQFIYNTQGELFASDLASKGGVEILNEEGVPLMSENSGLPDTLLCALACDSSGILYAAGPFGVYRSVSTTLGVHTGFSTACNLQNSPNPFPQSTTISFTLTAASYISLDLFDAAGRQVARIASGYYGAGAHDVAFARGNLPDGVYFYRLEAIGSVQTRALVIEE